MSIACRLPVLVYMRSSQTTKVGILWNEASGWNKKTDARQAVEKILKSGGAELDVHPLKPGSDPRIEARRLLAAGADILAAAGGDGTLNAAASALIDSRVALGVLPAGTLNHFARDLGIPINPEKAATLLLKGDVVPVDAGIVNGRVFINNSVLGLFPNYRSTREAWERKGFGRTRLLRLIAMCAGFLRVFWRMPHLKVQLRVGNTTHDLKTPFVLVGNNEHQMEGLELGKRSSLNQGKLWVYVMRPCSRWGWLHMVIRLLSGRMPRESAFRIFETDELRIDSRPKRLGVGIDGEMVRMTAPLVYRSLPGALRVVVPARSSAAPALLA